jgi:hypothetical protein
MSYRFVDSFRAGAYAVDGVGRSTRALFAILNKGCLLRVGLFIILCVAGAPWIH